MAQTNAVGNNLTGTSGQFSFVGRDVDSNISANNVLVSFQEYASPVTVNVDSSLPGIIQITGTDISTVVMPDVTTLVQGFSYEIINSSTGVCTINSFGSNLIKSLAAGTSVILTCVLITGTTAASWYVQSIGTAGAVLLSPSGNQTITSNNLILSTGRFIAQQDGFVSGTAAGNPGGLFYIFSPTASSGGFGLVSANNAGNFEGEITNVPFTANRTLLFPDASGTIALVNPIATISGTTQTAVVNKKYYAQNAAQTVVTLPATSTESDFVAVLGTTTNVGGWQIQAPAGVTIQYLDQVSTAGGTLTCTAANAQYVYLECDVADTSWIVTSTVSTNLTTA